MIRLSLYTKNAFLAKGLESELRQAGGFKVLPLCGMLAGLAKQMTQHKPDLLLVDLGPEVTFAVLSGLNRVAESKVVLWVDSPSADLAFQAMRLGVRGILRKKLPSELHVKCLRKVYEGELWFEKTLTQNVASRSRVVLTPGETHLVRLLCEGLKNKEIAGSLTVSEDVVKGRLSQVFQKLGVKDRFELALFGLKHLSIGLGHGEEARVAASGPPSKVEAPNDPFGFSAYARAHGAAVAR